MQRAPSAKTTGRTDVSAGRFISLEPTRRMVQSVEFDSDDASLWGEMIMTWSFEPTAAGTMVTITAETSRPASLRTTTTRGCGRRSRTSRGTYAEEKGKKKNGVQFITNVDASSRLTLDGEGEIGLSCRYGPVAKAACSADGWWMWGDDHYPLP